MMNAATLFYICGFVQGILSGGSFFVYLYKRKINKELKGTP